MVAFALGCLSPTICKHHVPVLWEFLKAHHSAQVLTPITVFRMYPIDDILSGIRTALPIGTVAGVFAWALGPVAEIPFPAPSITARLLLT